jgi:hypothetical protein
MNIEFNPSSPTGLGATQSAARRAPSVTESESSSFEQTRALEQKLSQLPDTRPEEVARARTLIADNQYPPQLMMNRIASLLAIHVKNS